MKGKKKEHFWTHVGFDKHHNALGHCDLCDKYNILINGKKKIISKKEYERIVIPGSWNW